MAIEMMNSLEAIETLPDNWHGSGTVPRDVLRAIAKHAQSLGRVHHSVETGSGRTTLLFSHLSENHVVFAVDYGGSISQVKNSPFFNASNVNFIEGPSQITLPAYKFPSRVSIAFIDGAHGYPFPDLDYYYFYPQIETGGLLIVDDISIPTIRRMYEIIKMEDMFDLIEVVADTAFFRRTEAPLINPLGDEWTLQGYNRRHYQRLLRNISMGQKFPWLKQIIPVKLKMLLHRLG